MSVNTVKRDEVTHTNQEEAGLDDVQSTRPCFTYIPF